MTNLMWPQDREFPLPEFVNSNSLRNAWALSRQIISELRDTITSETVPPELRCIAISGSIARMEAHKQSDMDVLIVLDDQDQPFSPTVAENCHKEIWRRLLLSPRGSQLKRPKVGGIFSECVSSRAITDANSRGVVDEDIAPYGQRMQLLMDAQPIYANQPFHELQCEVLDWYSEIRVSQLFNESGPFHWLWQDVQRYWRSIRSRNCWADAEAPLKSFEVNLKLRSSRIVMIAAFLNAICEAHRSDESTAPADVMARQIRQTPMERLSAVLNAASMQRLMQHYETVWQYTATITEMPPGVPDDVLSAIAGIKNSLANLPEGDGNWTF